MLGALDSLGDLTDLGKKMVEFPLDPTLSKVLILSEKYGCSLEIVIIISMLSIQTIFNRPKDKESEADKAKSRLFISESDHLTLLNIYLQWESSGYSYEWSKANFIHQKSLNKAKEIRLQLVDIMKSLKIKVISCNDNWINVRKCITSGFFHNSAKLKTLGEYVNIKSNIPCVLHPSSAVYSLGYTPDYVIYHELIMTNKEYMSTVTVIEPEWLVEVAPLFYSIKEMNIEDRLKNERNREKLMNIEMKMREILEKKKEQLKAKDLFSAPISKGTSKYRDIIKVGSTGPKSISNYSTLGSTLGVFSSKSNRIKKENSNTGKEEDEE
jgi:pre-mRNA-splicing factor ATP-dependent RNA helicase DHX38/PRP16